MNEEALALDGLVFEAVELCIDNHIMTICLNRPDRKNAINTIMCNEIIYALDYAKQERSIRVVVFSANGNVFCAGGDLRAMSGKGGDETRSNVPQRGNIDDLTSRLRHLHKPTIACIQGDVLAGALLIICNVTHAIAAEEVKFSTPEIKRGIWPFMVMAGLFRVMPKRAGLDFIMRGEPISAADAEKWGLINKAVPTDFLEDHVNTLAGQLANLAPNSMVMGLASFIKQEDEDYDSALPYLRSQLDACVKSPDAKEGIAAFLEKREPNWD